MTLDDQIMQWIDALAVSGDCPFAQPAYNQGRVTIIVESSPNLFQTIFSAFPRPEHMVLIAFDPAKLSDAAVEDIVDRANELLAPRGLMALYTHPQSEHACSHHSIGAVFIQHEHEMQEAVSMLRERTSYYVTRDYPEWAR